jgi:hypothetical protein
METQSHGLSLPLLDDAAATARPLGHGFIAPEHLLLAVAARPEGASGAFLERHGLTAVVHMRPPTECSGVSSSPRRGPHSAAGQTVARHGVTYETAADHLRAILPGDGWPGAIARPNDA